VLEDIEKTSSAGQQETYLNVRGDEALITSVKKVWASLFTPRAIYYRYRHNQPQDTAIGVIVQRMVNAEKAGVSFTVDPARPVEGKDEILTEAAFGVGEVVVQGLVDPTSTA
jgi:pyruvate,water dikinase